MKKTLLHVFESVFSQTLDICRDVQSKVTEPSMKRYAVVHQYGGLKMLQISIIHFHLVM